MRFLTEVNDSTGLNPVRLDYSVLDAETQDGELVPELRLNAVRYNFHPLAGCPKHEIRLAYRSFPGGSPKILEYTVQNGLFRARSQLVNRIDILARGDNCASSQKRLRRYQLEYGFDEDTLQPRLRSADLYGKEGTPEASTAIPVARYRYGSLRPGGIGYIETNTISMPTAAAGLASAVSSMMESGNRYATRHMLIDFNGDNRTDLLFPNGGFEKRNVWIARNKPINPIIPEFVKSAFVAPEPLFTDDMANIPLGEQVTRERRYRYGEQVNTEDTIVQAVDFNGDGRTDILDARNKGFWVLYLNVPPESDPNGIEWQKKRIDTEPIRKALMTHGQWDITIPWPIPLKRSRTGRNIDMTLCWDFVRSGGFGGWKICKDEVTRVTSGDQYTHTEWMLSDVNGDGWIDLVVNSVAIDRITIDNRESDCSRESSIPKPSQIPPPYGYQRVYCDQRSKVDFIKPGNRLQVHYNMAGAQLRNSVQPFAPRTNLEDSECEVEEWFAASTGVPDGVAIIDEEGNPTAPPPRIIGPLRSMTCGLIDVSGDGISDRIRNERAYLGTGQDFSLSLTLPGPASRIFNGRDEVCGRDVEDPLPDAEYEIERYAGFVDITGDGIPDYVRGNKVRIGTGTGWTDDVPVLLAGGSFSLSKSIETCEGPVSKTVAGLYDIDGDGRLDLVEANGGNFRTFQLVSNDGKIGAHNAGRIVEVENGFGAKVSIEYASAKNDFDTIHRVPFKEIVAHKFVTESADGTMEPVLFAYGHAELRFDAAMDRWIFPGYGRTIVLRGQEDEKSTVRRRLVSGTATIKDRVQLKEFPSNYDSYALVGRTKDIHLLDGTLPGDAWSLLPTDFTVAPAEWHGQIHYEYDTFNRTMAIQGLDCTKMDQWEHLNKKLRFQLLVHKMFDLLTYDYNLKLNKKHFNSAFKPIFELTSLSLKS